VAAQGRVAAQGLYGDASSGRRPGAGGQDVLAAAGASRSGIGAAIQTGVAAAAAAAKNKEAGKDVIDLTGSASEVPTVMGRGARIRKAPNHPHMISTEIGWAIVKGDAADSAKEAADLADGIAASLLYGDAVPHGSIKPADFNPEDAAAAATAAANAAASMHCARAAAAGEPGKC